MWDYASRLSSRSVGELPPADGRVAFRIRIGVTGHVDLTEAEIAAVRDPLRGAISRIQHDLIASDVSTPIRLAVVSQLAEGADRLAVWEVLRHAAEQRQDADVEVVLPMELTEFIRAQRIRGESLAEFEWLLEGASSTVRVGHAATEEAGYELAAHWLVQRSDVLIAIWRGDPSGGSGGTAETLRLAAHHGLPCIWIRPDGDPPTADNFDRRTTRGFYEKVNDLARLHGAETTSGLTVRGDVLAPLRHSYAELRPFNRGRWYELGYPRSFGPPSHDGLPHVAVRRRASVLAQWNQRVFKGLVITISACAIAAAIVLAFSVTYSKGEYLSIAEPVAFTALFLAFVVLYFGRYKERWSSCRMFAERLRSIAYLHAVGADAPDEAGDELGRHRHPQDWVARAFAEVWDRGARSRPAAVHAELDFSTMKSLLADEWLGGQIRFHGDRAIRDTRWHRGLLGGALALFGAVWVMAILHAVGGRYHEPATFGLIALPAVVAALGAYDAVGLFAASARTSGEMVRALSDSQHEMARATSRDELALAARRAALVIAEETGDWESGLWSLEVHLL